MAELCVKFKAVTPDKVRKTDALATKIVARTTQY